MVHKGQGPCPLLYHRQKTCPLPRIQMQNILWIAVILWMSNTVAGQQQQQQCEFDVTYSITSVTRGEFEATMKIKSNRELASPLQLVYKFIDSADLELEYVTNAILMSRENSTTGMPTRLKTVKKYGEGEDALVKSAIKFNQEGTNGPSPFLRLGVDSLNVNGIQCSPKSGSMDVTYARCSNALAFFESFNGRPPPTNSGIDECSMTFCCGVLPTVSESKQVEPPAAEFAPPVPVPEPSSEDMVSAPVPETNGTNANDSVDEQTDKNVDETSRGEGGGGSGVLIGAAVGVAALLLIVVIVSVLVIRARRKRQVADSTQKRNNGSGNSGNKSSLGKVGTTTTTASINAMVGRMGSRHSSQIIPGTSVTHQSSVVSQTNLGEEEFVTPIDTLPDDLPEDVILHEQLGAGAFGTVFKGEWGGHIVAVKVLQTAYSSNSRELDSFRQEIAVLSGLRHPNIIAFLAACTIPPDICIIEELAEGGSLHTRLHGPSGSSDRCRPLPLDEVIQVGIDVAQAMVYLHPNIVHRDLKSQNVLLDADGRAKVCDFGIAKFKDRTFVSTVNGQAGTPAYMAPELFDGANATEKVDVYSYAILLWECMTGRVPWGHIPSPMQIIYYVGVLNQRPKMPATAPEKLKILIEDCWSNDPKARPTFESILTTLYNMKQDQETFGVVENAECCAQSAASSLETEISTVSSDHVEQPSEENRKFGGETKGIEIEAKVASGTSIRLNTHPLAHFD